MFAVQYGCEALCELRSTDEMEVKKDAGVLSIDDFARKVRGESLSD